MADLFSSSASPAPDSYDASSIEVLEGLEPVRRRPGMYIGGTDARALHHLAAEVIDNAMDEAVAGHASRIEVTLEPGNRLTVIDNGRGIPVDPHPKYPGKSALEVIMTTLHSGGKFEGKAYSHLAAASTASASASSTRCRPRPSSRSRATRSSTARPSRKGLATSPLEEVGAAPNRRGTTVTFTPDPEIFGADAAFDPDAPLQARPLQGLSLRRASRSAGAATRRSPRADVPEQRRVPVPRRPRRPSRRAARRPRLPSPTSPSPAARTSRRRRRSRAAPNGRSPGRSTRDGSESYYCNTIPTPDGGTHEAGLRAALTKGIRAFGELVGNKKAKDITADDVFNGVELML